MIFHQGDNFCRAPTLLGLAVLLLLSGCSIQNDHLIVPGKRVGRVVLGHNPPGPEDPSAVAEFKSANLAIGLNADNAVNGISVTGGDYKTDDGIRLGSKEDAVVAVYGSPEIIEVPLMGGPTVKGTFSKRALQYRSRGIIFLIDPHGLVWGIMVGDPNHWPLDENKDRNSGHDTQTP